MSDSPEVVVRKFLGAWADPDADTFASFFDDDAVWVDGPQGARRGAKAIGNELASQLAISHPTTIEVVALLADGRTVMVEQRNRWTFGGRPISTTVMAVFEIDANSRINQWRESYDLQSVLDQMAAAEYKG